MGEVIKKLSEEQAYDIIKANKYGVLSTVSEVGEPYGVAVNYYYCQECNSLVFHTKRGGVKIANIKANSQVSMFIKQNDCLVEEDLVTHYESVVVKGNAELVDDTDEKRVLLTKLCQLITPKYPSEEVAAVVERNLSKIYMVKIHIEKVSGKGNYDK